MTGEVGGRETPPTDLHLGRLVIDHEKFSRLAEEPYSSGLVAHVQRSKDEFHRVVSGSTTRGDPYGFGALRLDDATRLYALIREVIPDVVVETGVCNGVSTAFALEALDRIGRGLLWSIDFPEFTDVQYGPTEFWEGKKGAAVPVDREPGWVVPSRLRDRWTITLGRSQDALTGVLDELESIDFFIHDSEHSYECMTFEFEAAWARLGEGGVIVADDARWNSALDDFAARVNRTVSWLTPRVAVLVN